MSFWDAASMAAAITIALIGFAANKILDVDFTAFFRRNWKSTKCKKMLLQRKGPWQGTNVHGEIRNVFDKVLLPLGKADKELLPGWTKISADGWRGRSIFWIGGSSAGRSG